LIPRFFRRLVVPAAFLMGHVAPRDPRLWVFGNVKGFRDNPRYLAEHIAAARPELKPCWIARSESEAQAARASGIRVAMRGRAGAAVQFRAGAAFLSNGFQDLDAAYLGGSFVVELRHGQGTKRILLDQRDPGLTSPSSFVRAAARLRRWYVKRRLAEVDMIIAPGQLEKSALVSAFGGSPTRIHVLGTPRFDVIHGGEAYERVAGGDLRLQLDLRPNDYVVLWLPTWREEGDSWLPPLARSEVQAALAGTRVVLLVKPHPYSEQAVFQERLPRHPRLRLLTEDQLDVNCLLRIADALVTDYSSAAFDYALLDRPILFFSPDLDEYRAGHGLNELFKELTAGHHHRHWARLLAAVRAAALGGSEREREIARHIRERSMNNDAPGSCARIVAAVAAQVGVTLEGPGR
jgi:CDP-glycerol glycerophosphotransferase